MQKLGSKKKSHEKHLFEIDPFIEVFQEGNERKVISPPPNNFILNKDGPNIDDFVMEFG